MSRRSILPLALLACAFADADAQLRASVNVGGGEVGFGTVPASAVTLDGELAYRRDRLTAIASAGIYRFDRSARESSFGRAELTLRPRRRAGLTGELAALVTATNHHDFYRASRVEVRGGAAWIAARAATTVRYGLAGVRHDGASLTTSRVELEATGTVGSASFTLFGARSAFRDAKTVVRDTTYFVAGYPFRGRYRAEVDVDRAYLDAEARVHWQVLGAGLGASVGARLGDATTASDRWQRMDLSWPLRSNVALIATAGRRPGVPEERLPSGAFAILGVQLSFQETPRAAAPRGANGHDTPRLVALDVGGGRRSISIIGLGASRVEIIADFTDWEAVDLASIGNGVWHVTMPVPPGAHRISVRVDGGAWMPPPGLPVTADEFMGTVGVLLIEQ